MTKASLQNGIIEKGIFECTNEHLFNKHHIWNLESLTSSYTLTNKYGIQNNLYQCIQCVYTDNPIQTNRRVYELLAKKMCLFLELLASML